MFIELFLFVLLSTAIWIIGTCIYNLLFHPLRHYPGPLLARATRVYFIFWDVQGWSHWKVKEWHEKHGDVVRIAPDELSYTNGEAWPNIYGFPNKEGTGNFPKDLQFFNKAIGGVESIMTADDATHRRMRRLQSAAFSERALKAQESVIGGYAGLLLHQLNKQASSPESATVDMAAWYSFYSFDTIGDLSFGEPFHCLRDAKSHWWLEAVFDIFQALTYLRTVRRFPKPLSQILMLLIPKRLTKARHSQVQLSVNHVRKRLEQETDRSDFMSYMIGASEGKGVSMKEMYVTAKVLITAGSETTAVALSGATYLLLSNPRTLQLLSAEIRNRFQDEEEITMSSTVELPYLNAVLEEALRLYPPATGTFPRTVPMPGKMLSINRSSRNFREPNYFIPERWLRNNVRFQDDKRSAMQPFSYGPRNCIGRNLAYAEMRIALSRMIWNFDMKLDPDNIGWIDRQKMYTSWQMTSLKVQLIPRT